MKKIIISMIFGIIIGIGIMGLIMIMTGDQVSSIIFGVFVAILTEIIANRIASIITKIGEHEKVQKICEV